MKKYNLSESIIEKTFYIAVWFIEKTSSKEDFKGIVLDLNKLEEGTLGKEIANCLKENNLNLVPHFESHDLKHALLNFKMTPLDEIRLQAFMIGNGNWSIPSFAIFIYGALLLPFQWKVFLKDYKAGEKAVPIKDWSIEEFAERQLDELQDYVLNSKAAKTTASKKWSLHEISILGSFATIFAGGFGMLFCFPFLWSSNLADLVGAGFPFVAGAILIIGGLINLSILSQKPQMNTEMQ